MTEQNIMDVVAHRQWLVLTGLGLMALVVFGRNVAARAGLTGLADKGVSVASAYLSDLSWMLPAAGYDYWPWALVAALRGTLMSGGLAEFTAELIKRRWPPVAAVGLLLVALVGSGCTAENRCLAERSTVAALGVAAGLASGLVPDTDEGEQAMQIVTSSIGAGEVLVQSCEQLRDDADGWRGWLSIAVSAIKAVLAIVRAAGVAIPEQVGEAVSRLDELLATVAPPIEREAPYEPPYFD